MSHLVERRFVEVRVFNAEAYLAGPPGTGDTVGGGDDVEGTGLDGAVLSGTGFDGTTFIGGGFAGEMLSGGKTSGTGFAGGGFTGAGLDGPAFAGGTGFGIVADPVAGGTGLGGTVVCSCMQPAESRLQLFGLLQGGVGADWANADVAAISSKAGKAGVFMTFSSRGGYLSGQPLCRGIPIARHDASIVKESAMRTESRITPPRKPTPPFPPQHQDKPGIEAELRPRPQFKAPDYRAAGKLDGKAALVTGADSGIGRAVAVLFAREGADVAITYLPEEKRDADETRAAVEAEGRQCLLLAGDLRDAQFCEHVVEATVKRFGKLDVLVSNAAHQNRKPLEELDDKEMMETFETNVFALMRLSRQALRHMQHGAAIIATSSETGILGSPKLPDYSATKGAINAFVKSLAQDLVKRGIRVNAVAPGPVWTPLNAADRGEPPDKVSQFGSQAPIGRPAQPEEVAPAYVFLASEADSSYVTGIVLDVMGGETAGG